MRPPRPTRSAPPPAAEPTLTPATLVQAAYVGGHFAVECLGEPMELMWADMRPSLRAMMPRQAQASALALSFPLKAAGIPNSEALTLILLGALVRVPSRGPVAHAGRTSHRSAPLPADHVHRRVLVLLARVGGAAALPRAPPRPRGRRVARALERVAQPRSPPQPEARRAEGQPPGAARALAGGVARVLDLLNVTRERPLLPRRRPPRRRLPTLRRARRLPPRRRQGVVGRVVLGLRGLGLT